MKDTELKAWMTDAQRTAWDAAIASGRSTELQIGAPECGSDGLWSPYCDDGRWTTMWTGFCFDVYCGVPVVHQWTCDGEGDWDTSYECDLDEFDEEAAYRRMWNEVDAAQRGYFEHVAETGDDPLDEFYVKRTETVTERWRIYAVTRPDGKTYITGGLGEGIHACPSAALLPVHVLHYLSVVEDDIRARPDEACVDWSQPIDKLGGITELNSARATDGQGGEIQFHSFAIEFDHNRPRNADVVAEELKAAARRSLQSMRPQAPLSPTTSSGSDSEARAL